MVCIYLCQACQGGNHGACEIGHPSPPPPEPMVATYAAARVVAILNGILRNGMTRS